jgi:benzoate membrane transport protein
LFFCFFSVVFGLLAPFFTRLLLATPPAFIATLAGLAMLRVLQSAFTASFGGRFSFGALACFLVTVADVPILRIGASFWGLVLGLAVAWLLERRA